MVRAVEKNDELIRRHREWLAWVRQRTGLTSSAIAKASDVYHTTLTKLENDPAHKTALSTRTIEKIKAALGVLGPGDEYASAGRIGMREDAVPYQPKDDATRRPVAVKALIDGRNGVDAWVMRTDVLALAGIRNGDVLIIDQNKSPRTNDVVCAQIYDRAGAAETVFRLYQPPFVVAAALEPFSTRPEMVDHDRVVIMGVMDGLVRA